MSTPRIAIFDTTLRDGEQSPGCSMNLDEKLRMARQLEHSRRRHYRSRIPDRFDGDFAAVKAVAASLSTGDGRGSLPHVRAGRGPRR